MNKVHPRAEPGPEVLGELDQTPKDELSDPLAGKKQRQGSSKALAIAIDDGTARASGTATARAVGECLSIGRSMAIQERAAWDVSPLCGSASPRLQLF